MAYRCRQAKPVDSRWPEVRDINSYSVLLGCLTMIVRGLSFLVVTWTTVILLGGFVSALQKEDFWCLTVITLIQMVWLADVIVMNKTRAFGHAAEAWSAVVRVYSRRFRARRSNQQSFLGAVALLVDMLLRATALVVQLVVYATAVVVFYVVLFALGLLVTTGISLWRLIQHSYGNVDGDSSKGNMSPALDVLYTLVVAQGAIFFYRIILGRLGDGIAKAVAGEYGFEGLEVSSVLDYLTQGNIGCKKDLSFAQGRNLVTYAVDLMGSSKSPEEYHSGTRILSALLGPFLRGQSEKFHGQHRLIKQLVGPSSPSHILQKMLKILNSRSRPYDREMQKCAARIVAHVADEIDLEQFPRGIQGILSLIDTFEQYHRRCSHTEYFLKPELEETYRKPCDNDIPNEKDYKELLLDGLYILWVLASDENNCRVISDTEGVLSKIMAPLTSDILHQIGHGVWADSVQGSLKVVRRLIVAPGKTGAKLRRGISTNKEAISTMMRISRCDECKEELQIEAMEILTRLDLDTQSREDFIKMLVDTFSDDHKDSFLAVEGLRLAMLSFQGGIYATIILQVHGDFVDRLAAKVVDFARYYSRNVIRAAELLENLCTHYTKDDEHLRKLKEAMTDVMPKVLMKILLMPREAIETDWPVFSPPHRDVEDPDGGASLDNFHNKSSSPRLENHEQRDNRKLYGALLSLCLMVWDTLIRGNQDFSLLFDATDASSLPSKLKDIVVGNSDPTASCLRILKVTSRMVISVMKHRGNYPKQDLESLVDALSSASTNMLLVDGSTVFASGVNGMPTKPVRTLASLTKEANELVRKYEVEGLK